MHTRGILAWLAAAVMLALNGCQDTRADELSRAEAIDIARQEVSFEPESVTAEKATEDGRPVWKITFRRHTGPHPMGGFMEVVIDRETGKVVSLTRT